MAFLLTELAVEENRTPDSKIRSPAFRLFGAVGTKNPVGLVATVFPEFIARDGQERADRGRQGNKRQGWCGPQRSEDTAWRALMAHGRGLQSRTR
ncbi:hypothetical protein [Burkholderia pseudomallei]|uniref:hypothetical protein n=1 Tax=Burkholderia pseudomallei TaxID=28450 RepID=UPI0012F4CBF3|nr:hypothetical protein [Burkholderia pseudomallei]